ncbi:hypothetical protein ESCOMMO115M_24595 [Escherichia coli]|nr:hypothetical protein BvCmsOUNP031_00295 [Escherichia coli]
MTGAAGRVEYFNTFGFNADRCNRRQLRLHFRRLLRRLNVVLHFVFQRRVRVGLQPLAANGVLYQILHNPVWRKQLGGGRNIFALHHFANHGIFLFRDIELIQPADNLYLLPVFFRNIINQPTQNGVGTGQVIRQQQFRFVIYRFKQERHRVVQGVALPQQQFTVQSFILITGKLHFNQLRFIFRQQSFCHFRHMIQHLKRGRGFRVG